MSDIPAYSVFQGETRVLSGNLREVALAVKRAENIDGQAPIQAFDNRTGKVIDIDTRGSESDVLARLTAEASYGDTPKTAKSRGRPRLGVVAREVTLLPRHWEWLKSQPGGASAALRRLVDEARRRGEGDDRRARDAAYYFLSAMAGNREGFEEASRALFAGDREGLTAHMAGWPRDIREHVLRLAFDALVEEDLPSAPGA